MLSRSKADLYQYRLGSAFPTNTIDSRTAWADQQGYDFDWYALANR